MKTQIQLAALLLLSTLNSQLSTCLAQGGLTPPGAPALLFKTLDQVKPGTAITNVPVTISVPGHFFLTQSLTSVVDGITIISDDVSLDLGGFTLTGDGGGGDDGVRVGGTSTNGQRRVTIRNGTVRNFGNGVVVNAFPSSVLVEDVLAYGCVTGFALSAVTNTAARLCTLRRCYAVSNAMVGILVGGSAATGSAENLIVDCIAQGNTTGIAVTSTNNLVIRNLSFGNSANDYFISTNNHIGTIVAPAVNTTMSTTNSPGSGTTDPFANLRY